MTQRNKRLFSFTFPLTEVKVQCHFDHAWKKDFGSRALWEAHGWQLGFTGRKYKSIRHRPSGIEPVTLILTVALIWVKFIIAVDLHSKKVFYLKIDD